MASTEMVTISRTEYEEYKQLKHRAEIDEELLKELVKGLQDIKAGRVKP